MWSRDELCWLLRCVQLENEKNIGHFRVSGKFKTIAECTESDFRKRDMNLTKVIECAAQFIYPADEEGLKNLCSIKERSAPLEKNVVSAMKIAKGEL